MLLRGGFFVPIICSLVVVASVAQDEGTLGLIGRSPRQPEQAVPSPAEIEANVVPQFEVAVVRRAVARQDTPSVSFGVGSSMVFPVGTINGGPGTTDPSRVIYSNLSLKQLLVSAYGVGFDQVFGPNWMESERYEITAGLPESVTKQDVRLMLRQLLLERFQMAVHHELRDFSVYELAVAKDGPKMKESVAPFDKPTPGRRNAGGDVQVGVDGNGFPQLPPGRTFATRRTPDGTYVTARAARLSELTRELAASLRSNRVQDHTGLTGRYDFTLRYDLEPSAARLSVAIDKQLGLRLEQTKAQLDVIVVDHAERVPTDN